MQTSHILGWFETKMIFEMSKLVENFFIWFLVSNDEINDFCWLLPVRWLWRERQIQYFGFTLKRQINLWFFYSEFGLIFNFKSKHQSNWGWLPFRCILWSFIVNLNLFFFCSWVVRSNRMNKNFPFLWHNKTTYFRIFFR